MAAEVGWAPERQVDVVVMDPFRASNGFALPLTRMPRMGLFATPPPATQSFGHYRSWAEELVTHEDAHLVHLMRPSRNRVLKQISGAIGVGPITWKSPAWVIEGYATVVEGRLTGKGRPNSAFRATLLRTWAREGRLPSYGQLDGSSRWQGRSARYLVGSAFLEWLELRRGPGSLRDLWAHLSARRDRGFDTAFTDLFGASAPVLYARFSAELSHQALQVEATDPADANTLFMDLSWSTGAPVISPDGSQLALVMRDGKHPGRLAVYDTADNTEAVERWQQRVEKTLARDPEDIAPSPPKTWSHQRTRLRQRNLRPPGDPRWMPDGQALLFSAWVRDAGGWGRPDLFVWRPEDGRERRITRGADLVDADPHPDGSWAVAVRSFWGSQQLVRVEISSGDWSAITPLSATTVYDNPRFNTAGDRFVFLRHQPHSGWRIVVHDVASGHEQELPLPTSVFPTNPAWQGDSLIASLGQRGFIDLYRVSLDGQTTRLTHAPGGALAPSVSGDSVFYLSMDSEGYDVHRLQLADALPPTPPPLGQVPDPPQVPMLQRQAVRSHPYGLGRQELRPFLGTNLGPGYANLEPGLRVGDVVGRSDLLAVASLSDSSGLDGALLGWALRSLPVTLDLQAFVLRRAGAQQTQRSGAQLTASADHASNTGTLSGAGGVWLDQGVQTEPLRVGSFGDLSLRRWVQTGSLWASFALDGGGRLGQTGADPWLAGRGQGELRLGLDRASVAARYGLGASSGRDALDRFRLGGAPSSVIPTAWRGLDVLMPALVASSSTYPRFETLHAELAAAPLALFGERYRLCDHAGGCELRSLLGLSMSLRAQADGLLRLPATETGWGVACVLPDSGPKPCQALGDWSGWIFVRWSP